jgi:hypothetical protein
MVEYGWTPYMMFSLPMVAIVAGVLTVIRG